MTRFHDDVKYQDVSMRRLPDYQMIFLNITPQIASVRSDLTLLASLDAGPLAQGCSSSPSEELYLPVTMQVRKDLCETLYGDVRMIYYTAGDTFTVAELLLQPGFCPAETRTKPSFHRFSHAGNFQLVMASPASRTTQKQQRVSATSSQKQRTADCQQQNKTADEVYCL